MYASTWSDFPFYQTQHCGLGKWYSRFHGQTGKFLWCLPKSMWCFRGQFFSESGRPTNEKHCWIVFFAYLRDRSAMLHCAPGSKILWLHQNASILSFGAWPNYPAFLVKMINELNLDLDTAKINIKVYFIQESVFFFRSHWLCSSQVIDKFYLSRGSWRDKIACE